LVFAAVAFTFAFGLSPQAGARTHRSGAHTHSAGAQAHGAACSITHTKHGLHTCSSSKGHKHKAKTEPHRKHALGSRHAPTQSKVQTPPAPTPGGSSGATCPNGVDATLNEEGTFSCGGGAEPGCQEGFAPVVSGDGSTLICEPEPGETGGEEED
jgi:hypothetical protein